MKNGALILVGVFLHKYRAEIFARAADFVHDMTGENYLSRETTIKIEKFLKKEQ